ncbi:MAG: YfiR family protein [Desulfuromonadaceae bacterium]|nr:YfiR family protein [Desulfuromonadaceae bacterium]MDD5107732.1 YfiR family protein [Desulfuromonadaceae bacterium]
MRTSRPIRHIIPYITGLVTRFGTRSGRFRPGDIVFLLILFTCLSLCYPPQSSCSARQKASENELKAVYLYNFLQFVQWPSEQGRWSKDNAKIIGVVGDSPFGTALAELQINVNQKVTNPIRVIYYGRYHEDMNLNACHLLFVSESEKQHIGKIMSAVKGSPVLTVSDVDDFISSGGMIALVRENGKIRWMINRGLTDKAGLRLSSQLLSIALRVVNIP